MKTSKYKIKVVCGYRKDQEFTLDANEAHKAYYLFEHPEKRGTFSNGLAIKGSDIQRIEPDYQATCGYSREYALKGEDMANLANDGTLDKLSGIMIAAREVARRGNLSDFQIPLHSLVTTTYPELMPSQEGSQFSKKVLTAKKHVR